MKSDYRQIIKEYGLYYSLGGLLLFFMKLFYSRASVSELLFLLAPVTSLVSAVSGIPFLWESHAGYVSHTLRFVIAPSCSGMQFMMIVFATLFFTFLHRIKPAGRFCLRPFLYMAGCLVIAYLYTLPTNALRILLAIYLPAFLEQTGLPMLLSSDKLHTLIGIVIYFTTLFSLYGLAASFSARSCHLHFSLLPPIVWYLTFVLGIPLLTGSLLRNPRGYLSYALLTIGICLSIFILIVFFKGILQKKCS